MAFRFLIDLQAAQNNSKTRGIGRYSTALAKGIVRNAGRHQVFCLLSDRFPGTVEEVTSAFAELLAPQHFLVISIPGPVSEQDVANSWRRRTSELLREYMIHTLAPDATLVLSICEGIADETVTSVGRLTSEIPTASIIYDLIPLKDSEKYFPRASDREWYQRKLSELCNSDRLFAISDATMRDAIEILKYDSERIISISAAADSVFLPPESSKINTQAIRQKYGLTRAFVMHASALDERKNFEGLIQAYSKLPSHIRKANQLVLVCGLDPVGHARLHEAASRFGVEADELVLTGHVPDSDLSALYAECKLFVFPSFSEGFGLPPLEAMSCGAATIGSNIESVSQVINLEDALFDPKSTDSMSAAILRALTDDAFFRQLKANAIRQSGKFSWDNTARRAISGLEQMVRDQDQSADSGKNRSWKRHNFLKHVGEASRGVQLDDSELLNLARAIEVNDLAIERIQASEAWRLARKIPHE
jgi:glycosyltransferase involved in cell wall biosynthesis